MPPPIKPFDTYKWRWLSVQPSEGLLVAPVFLGVLRALHHHEGEPYSSISLHEELKRVSSDTGSNVDLARTPERNLFRNSGQYWRGTGLLESMSGQIALTDLGKRISTSQITIDEFVTLMIRNTVLPNPKTYSQQEIEKWRSAKLRIKPFEIILGVMDMLGRKKDLTQAYLTPNELIKIVIPLAGARATLEEITDSLVLSRNEKLDISAWPDCAPAANDKRLAREFLLFLFNFGICNSDNGSSRYNEKFSLEQILQAPAEVSEAPSFLEDAEMTNDEIKTSRHSEIPTIIERKRVSANVLRRTNQSAFRKCVLNAGNKMCVITKETILDVIDAAHIIPISHGGTDHVGNGLCMRVDLHRLFDGGKIRLMSSGELVLNEQLQKAVSYHDLPKTVTFPSSVNPANVQWRSQYL